MPARVADASMIAAIAFREAEAEQALELVEGTEVHAPHLLAYELARVARKKAAVDPEQREAVLRAHQRSLALAIHRDKDFKRPRGDGQWPLRLSSKRTL
jgi:predicted nucleic acid-binding protein